jgi:CTP synthase (UTP-ammonia lyase)
MKKIKIGLIGDYQPNVTAHKAIPKALKLSSEKLNCEVEYLWLDTDLITKKCLGELNSFDGLWSVPATPYKDMEGTLSAIKFARENNIPFLGTCGGFQHAVIEYFRNVIGIKDADHLETNPGTQTPVISMLSCSMVEREGDIFIEEGTSVKKILGDEKINETYHCNYGFNHNYLEQLKKSNLKISGYDENKEIRIIELQNHPFFITTLFQPERSSLQNKNHPLIDAFVEAAINKNNRDSSLLSKGTR